VVTVRANKFFEVLGEGSRAIKVFLTIVNVTTATVLVLLPVWHTHRLVQQREAFEKKRTERGETTPRLASDA
jgi:hypothetical protein